MTFILTDAGGPMYSLEHKGISVLEPGVLGFELRGTVKYQGLVYKGDKIEKPDELPPYMFTEGFEILDTEHQASTRPGSLSGAKSPAYATTTTSCSSSCATRPTASL